jgi:hypothetical protein
MDGWRPCQLTLAGSFVNSVITEIGDIMTGREYNDLKSTQGVQIEIDYIADSTISGNYSNWQAAGINLMVGCPIANFSAIGYITLVLINRNSEQFQMVYEITMNGAQVADGVMWFSNNLFDQIPIFSVSEDGTPTFYSPQIAVVIDGVWQVDPVQPGEQHNFNFKWLGIN